MAAMAIVAGMVVANRRPVRIVAPEQSRKTVASLPLMPSAPTPPAEVPVTQTRSRVQPQNKITEVPLVANPQPGASQVIRPAKSKPPIQDPDARVALSLVGVDAKAEEYWFAAINDWNLSAHERKDLIEDLNEDGLSDPKHPGPEDMPLIWSRIQIIEELAPYAMDDVNANAFAEAYKDLMNLAGGQPAQ